MKLEKDYYAILNIAFNAEDLVVRAAYRALAQRYHPDRNQASDEEATVRMQEINQAYAVLSDATRRKKYDGIYTQNVKSRNFTNTERTGDPSHQESPPASKGERSFDAQSVPNTEEKQPVKPGSSTNWFEKFGAFSALMIVIAIALVFSLRNAPAQFEERVSLPTPAPTVAASSQTNKVQQAQEAQNAVDPKLVYLEVESSLLIPHSAILDKFGEDMYSELQTILLNNHSRCKNIAECVVDGWTITPINIGVPAFLATHTGHGGSGGITTSLMAEKNDGTWHLLASEFVYGGINIEATSSYGYKDISFSRKHYYEKKDGWFLTDQTYSWNGREYTSKGRPVPNQ
jgi:DnaJ domain